MYHLLVKKYRKSKKYRKITDSLWNYYSDKPSDPLSSNCESFEYKTSIKIEYSVLTTSTEY